MSRRRPSYLSPTGKFVATVLAWAIVIGVLSWLL